MRKIIIFLCVFVLIFSSCPNIYAENLLPETIKIGLFYSTTAKSSLTLSSESEFDLYYDNQLISTGVKFDITSENNLLAVNSSGEKIIECDNKKVVFTPKESFIAVNGREYRGSIEIINLKNGKFTVINEVNFEEYLYSVLPREMATGWPLEALKAQAVCARTYALTSMGRFKDYGFDLTDNTLSQVYGGVVDEKEDCTRAVDETKGMIVTYDNKPASVFYYASSSGESLDVKDVWGSSYPYLVSVKDDYQKDVVKDNAKWVVNYTTQELTERMNTLGYDLGTIYDVEINETSPQGAVTMVTVKGSKNSAIFERERARTIFNFRSQVYTVTTPSKTSETVTIIGAEEKVHTSDVTVLTAFGQEKVKTAVVKGEKEQKEYIFENTGSDLFTFTGYGYGHGIGMSQNGAKGMAKAGFTYSEILTHYFTGTEITKYEYPVPEIREEEALVSEDISETEIISQETIEEEQF